MLKSQDNRDNQDGQDNSAALTNDEFDYINDPTVDDDEDVVGFFSDIERLQRMRQDEDSQFEERKRQERVRAARLHKNAGPRAAEQQRRRLREAVEASRLSAQQAVAPSTDTIAVDADQPSTDEFPMKADKDSVVDSESRMWTDSTIQSEMLDGLSTNSVDENLSETVANDELADGFDLLQQGGLGKRGDQLSRYDTQRLRRRKRQRRTITVASVLALLAVLCGVGTWVFCEMNENGSFAWIQDEFAHDYPGPGYGSVQFTVYANDTATEIGERLATQHVVASKRVFVNAVEADNDQSNLQPGTFDLKYHMNAQQVVAILVDPNKAKDLLQVRSDTRAMDIVSQIVADNPAWTTAQVTAALNNKGVGVLPPCANGSYEGWLQPGTYDPKSYKTPADMLAAMVKARIAALDALNVPTGPQREKILTIASIIGGEVNQSQYYGKVSRVIANRLAQNMPLGMDSVIAYGNNTQDNELTEAMLTDTSNPYNDRIHVGLPPTPINQPNSEMIKAAMNPTPGNWVYFVTVNLDTGETKFTDNNAQFQQYKSQYEAWQKNHPNG
ncbi:MAG: endolytic transglycosylase MltG [Bifidobacteriaceae bacterium]|nr:endolytic transglycosylase MltG [Bifidobacteriaceae bacterium]